jgi:lysophospholipase L1-like esterase
MMSAKIIARLPPLHLEPAMFATRRLTAWYRFSLVLLALLAAPRVTAAEDYFPLHDGDTWIMAGDSITAQHLHSNYFEAFCFARYPDITFRFRNSGVGGDTVPKVLARYDWDIAPWKPTVVSVELGMNDKGGFTTAQYIANMKQLDERIRKSKARPVYFTASPVNSGDTQERLGSNARLNEYAVALEKFAAEQDAPFADQFHALLDIWGRNKPRENLADLLDRAEFVARDRDLVGVKHLQAFLDEQRLTGQRPVSMQGDPVHPGAPGQLMMAAALLQDLNADRLVSSAVLDWSGKVVSTERCTIDGVAKKGDLLAFDRIDERSAFPIPNEARGVLPLFPAILDLSRYTLTIKGLDAGKYALTCNGKPLGEASADELAAGINLTKFPAGAIVDQGLTILNAVSAKEGLVNQWRNMSRVVATGKPGPEAQKQLDATAKSILAADAAIRSAAKPKALHFEVKPKKG